MPPGGKNVNMHPAPGEVVGLAGAIGLGQEHAAQCLGAIIEPTAGRMTLGDEVIYDNGWPPDLRALRRATASASCSRPVPIPFLDVTDNVALLPMLAGVPNTKARKGRWNCSPRWTCSTALGGSPASSRR